MKNKIFCVLISMLETNIKRIIKLIDLLVKEGFSGHTKSIPLDVSMSERPSSEPWSGTFRRCRRPMWWYYTKFISRKFSRRESVLGKWICFGCLWKRWKCFNQLYPNCNDYQFLFKFNMFAISMPTVYQESFWKSVTFLTEIGLVLPHFLFVSPVRSRMSHRT